MQNLKHFTNRWQWVVTLESNGGFWRGDNNVVLELNTRQIISSKLQGKWGPNFLAFLAFSQPSPSPFIAPYHSGDVTKRSSWIPRRQRTIGGTTPAPPQSTGWRVLPPRRRRAKIPIIELKETNKSLPISLAGTRRLNLIFRSAVYSYFFTKK